MAQMAAAHDNRVNIAKAGGIIAIITGMRMHAEDAGVQKEGCRALKNIGINNTDNQVEIKDAGGLTLLEACDSKGLARIHRLKSLSESQDE